MRSPSIFLSASLTVMLVVSTAAGAPLVLNVTGTYDENVVNSNTVDKSAAGAPNDVVTFTNDVLAAYNAGFGGVIDFDEGSFGTTDLFRGVFDSGARYVDFHTSAVMQSVGRNGSFDPISGGRGTTSTSDRSSWELTVGPGLGNGAGGSNDRLRVNQIGLTVLSRDHSQYPIDVRATATYSDLSTESIIANIGRSTKIDSSQPFQDTDDTFFGFTAPAGTGINSIRLESFAPGTTNPRSTRIAMDDLGFITVPEPWTRIDNFEGYDPGDNIHGRNGWSASGTQTVETDPGAFGNQALKISESGRNIYTGATIADGDTGTLFFRFYVPSGTDAVDFGVGTTSNSPPTSGSQIADYLRIYETTSSPYLRVDVYDDDDWQTVGSFLKDSWYNVWNVIDNETNTWQARIEGPGFTGQEEAHYGDPSTSVFDFRGSTTAGLDLVNFYIRTNAGHNGEAYIDDIYMNSSAKDLTSPVFTPSSVVLIDLNGADNNPTPGALWNTINTPGDATEASPMLLVSANGAPSGVAIALAGPWEASGLTNESGAFSDTHPGLEPGAEDYLFLRDTGTEGTVTLSGLTVDRPYRVEIVSSASDASRDRLQDILVAGEFADGLLDGQDFDSYQDGYLDGSLLVWNRVFPDIDGNILIDVKVTGTASQAFAQLNAIRLMAVPEPGTAVLLALGLLVLVATGRRRV
ncbi:MAG: PEP-CTERM sorting domain-containing protein [Thermoguttaceae bacterium]|jgi:hypothetical protein|nr:PEP-CTERM sorting domain-containing protein [Thermoguttaceae bacterium]